MNRQIRNTSIRIKVLVPFILVLVGLMGATLSLVDRRFDQQTAASAWRELQSAGIRYHNQLAAHQNLLRKWFQDLANETKYRSVLQTLDPNLVRDTLARMVEEDRLADEGSNSCCLPPARRTPPRRPRR